MYTALIAFIWYEGDEEEKNLNTLLDLLNESETREEDETELINMVELDVKFMQNTNFLNLI